MASNERKDPNKKSFRKRLFSFGKGKKNKDRPALQRSLSEPHDKDIDVYQVRQRLKALLKFTEDWTKNCKKVKYASNQAENDFKTLEKYFRDVQACFYYTDTDLMNDRHDDRTPNSQTYVYDDSGGFKEHRQGNRPTNSRKLDKDDSGGFTDHRSRREEHRQISDVTVHKQLTEPPADYTIVKQKPYGRTQSLPDDPDSPFKRSRSQGYQPGKQNRKREHDLTEALKVQEETNQRLQSKIKSYEKELDKFKRDLNLETKAREDAQNRLSEMMGRQLKTNNPAITDLSDPDRPLNLVDKFSNIYDNEWTDTIEEMEKIAGDESTATKILLTLVTDTYTECYNLRHKGNVWLQLEDRITSVKQKVNGVPEDIKNVLKQMKVEQLQSLKQAILNKMNAEVDRKVLTCLTKSKKQYLDKCLEVCWMMVCHSPPVHLEWNYKGHSFDLQILKPFTESGDMVDFVVWPVTFLHKDGPLLCKGVAQGAQSSQVVSAKSRQTHF